MRKPDDRILSLLLMLASLLLFSGCIADLNVSATTGAPSEELLNSEWAMEANIPARSRYAAGDIQTPMALALTYSVDTETQYVSPVSIADELLFAEADHNLKVLSLADGEERWQFNLNGSFLSPAVANKMVFVRSEAADEGYIYALAVDDGTIRWQYKFPRVGSAYDNIGGHVTSPVTTDDLVIVGAANSLYAFDQGDGSVVWEFQMRDPVSSAASISGDTVYVTDFSRLYALSLESGEEQWRYDFDGVTLLFSPIATTDRVIVTNLDTAYSFSRENGELLWAVTFSDLQVIPAAAGGDVVYVKSTSSLFALDMSSGELLWTYNGDDFVSLPAVTSEQLFVIVRSGGQGQLRVVERMSGQELWRTEGESLNNAAPVIAGDVVFVRTIDGRILGFESVKEN